WGRGGSGPPPTPRPWEPPRNHAIDCRPKEKSHETIHVAAANPAGGSPAKAAPTSAAASPPAPPPATAATAVGAPHASRCAATTAPTATKAPWASDGRPATPIANASPTAAHAR